MTFFIFTILLIQLFFIFYVLSVRDDMKKDIKTIEDWLKDIK
jgi:preprotein translocase subunit YajC